MSVLQGIQSKAKKVVPVIRTGYTVRVHQRIKEGEKERIQIFEGLVIKINSGHGADKTFTVRKVVEGIGVEKIFPLYSANIAKIEVKKIAKIRRAKLYYMRERSGKSARLKEIHVTKDGIEMEHVESAKAQEEPKADAESNKTEINEEAKAPEPTPSPEVKSEAKNEEKNEAPEKEETKTDDVEPQEAPKEESKAQEAAEEKKEE